MSQICHILHTILSWSDRSDVTNTILKVFCNKLIYVDSWTLSQPKVIHRYCSIFVYLVPFPYVLVFQHQPAVLIRSDPHFAPRCVQTTWFCDVESGSPRPANSWIRLRKTDWRPSWKRIISRRRRLVIRACATLLNSAVSDFSFGTLFTIYLVLAYLCFVVIS